MRATLEGVEEFNRELRAFQERVLPEVFVTSVRWLGIKILIGCIAKTPVDTGTLRGGWILSIEEPVEEPVPGLMDKDGRDTIERAYAVVAALAAGQSLWVCNPVEYASHVNDGTDKRAGDFMLERTFAEAQQAFPGVT